MSTPDPHQPPQSSGGRPPAWLVSAESLASPIQMRPRDPQAVRWYLPDWSERFRLMGWWNLLWLPPLAMAALGVSSFIYGSIWLVLLGWWKVIVILIGVPTGIALAQCRTALRHRQDPFCIHCGYSLNGLTELHPCPECGEATSAAICREYQRDPRWFIQRYAQRHDHPPIDVPFEAGETRVESRDGT